MSPHSVVAAAMLSAALLLGGCGGGQSENGDEVAGVGDVRAGSVASLAQCSDWKGGTEDERWATIADIRAQLDQAGADGPTPELSEDDAYDLFERACANDYAAGFRLYKIYSRGAAFSRFAE
jgi:hypothetical protein